MKVYELKTKNGRAFRVAVNNDNQEKRLLRIVFDNKNKSYEIFESVTSVLNGIHDIKTFEKLANELK